MATGFSTAAQPVAWSRATSIAIGAPVRCLSRTSPVHAGWRCVCKVAQHQQTNDRLPPNADYRRRNDPFVVLALAVGFFELPHQRAIGWKKFAACGQIFGSNGDPGPIRTGGLRFRKPLLYPAELRGRFRYHTLGRFDFCAVLLQGATLFQGVSQRRARFRLARLRPL